MKRNLMMFLVSFTLATGLVAVADDHPILNPLDHIRIEYDKFNTPDSLVFRSLLEIIRTYSEGTERLQSWVFTEMNMSYSSELEAWVTPQLATLRHSREDIEAFITLLEGVAERAYQTDIAAKKELFCPVNQLKTNEIKYQALEKRDLDQTVEADFFLEYTLERIDEQARADLRSWLSRMKNGFHARKYDYRTLWAGRENELDSQFSAICKELGAEK